MQLPIRPPPPPKLAVAELATSAGGRSASNTDRRKQNQFSLNGVPYTRLDCIGRGGSCRVYRVIDRTDTIFALKRVDLKNCDPMTVRDYKTEIDLLKKLEHADRVVDLKDWKLDIERQLLTLVYWTFV